MPMIYIKVNYPDLNKPIDILENIIQNIDDIVSDIFSPYIYFKVLRVTTEGPILIFIINKNAYEIKKVTIEIENKHILGKCVNMDVYDEDMNKISRTSLGYPPSKCFICGDIAEKCIREKKHTQDEVVEYIIKSYREYMESFYNKEFF